MAAATSGPFERVKEGGKVQYLNARQPFSGRLQEAQTGSPEYPEPILLADVAQDLPATFFTPEGRRMRPVDPDENDQ
ncbi:hypothetical protein [Nocardia xishanensis]